MKTQFQPSFLDRLLTRAPVRRLACSRVGRGLHLDGRYRRQMRRVNNRRLAAGVAAAEIRRAERAAQTTLVPSIERLRAEPSSSITTRFIVLCEGRSGSTLLVDELNRRWPEIQSKGEEFSERRRMRAGGFRNVARRTFIKETGKSIVGCKILGVQVSEQELESLLQLDDMRVIILRRRNQLRRYVSRSIAMKTSEWRKSEFRLGDEPLVSEKRFPIPINDLIKTIIETIYTFRWFESATEGLPRIEVWYEDLSADLDAELRRVATFLGAGPPAHESPPKLSKQNPEPLRELITNYDEVSEFLEDVGLAEFLIEEDRADESTAVAAEDNKEVPSPGEESARLPGGIHAQLHAQDAVARSTRTPTALAAIETMIVSEQQSDLQQAKSRP